MQPKTRARIAADQIIRPVTNCKPNRRAIRIAHKAILEAHHQSIHECADIALKYGSMFPHARIVSDAIAKRILEDADRYMLSQIDEVIYDV